MEDISQTFKKGIFDIRAEKYCSEGIPFVRISNLNNMGIDTSQIAHIPKKENQKNLSTYLQKGDIILSKTAYPAASLVDIDHCNCSQDTIAVKLKENTPIQNAFLVVFLNTKYGLRQMERWFTGNVQMHLNLIDSKGIVIPVLSNKIQTLINELFDKAKEKESKSFSIYKKISIQLSNHLNAANKNTNSEKSINVKNFENSFGKKSRLDAEYYQHKYDEMEKCIAQYPNDSGQIDEVCNVKNEKFYPKDNTQYQYIELSNIGSSGEITGCTTELGKDLPTRARRQVEKEDVIISSIEGSMESCSIIPEEYDGALCSTGFYIVNSDNINPETLLVLFKSDLMQEMLTRNCTGTILTSLNKTDFEEIKIPIIERDIQKVIKKKISESFRLRDVSKKLLEIAKRAIEIAIEKDEETAFNYISKQIESIKITILSQAF